MLGPSFLGAASAAVPSAHPGYVASSFYPVGPHRVVTNQAVQVLDTHITLYPFVLSRSLSPATLNIWVVTGAASSAVKMGIWRNGNGRPVGVPLAGLVSNTGQSTASTGAAASIAATGTLAGNTVYWAGFAFTTDAPTCFAIDELDEGLGYLTGRSALNGTFGVLRATYAYAGDITALDLTEAVFTGAISRGTPMLYLGTAA